MKCPVCLNDVSGTFRLKPCAGQAYKVCECGACLSSFSDPMLRASSESYVGAEFYGWRKEFDWFLEDLGLVPGGGAVLELGCGEGLLLGKIRGFDAEGVDFNGAAVERACKKGLKAYEAPAEEFLPERQDGKYSAIAAFHLLEHSEDPAGLLKLLHGALSENGCLFLSVPNPARVMFHEALREAWDYPPHHLVRFSARGLELLLCRCGFNVVKSRGVPWEAGYTLGKLAAFLDFFAFSVLGAELSGMPRLKRNLVRTALLLPLLLSYPRGVAVNLFRGGQSLYVVAKRRGSACI